MLLFAALLAEIWSVNRTVQKKAKICLKDDDDKFFAVTIYGYRIIVVSVSVLLCRALQTYFSCFTLTTYCENDEILTRKNFFFAEKNRLKSLRILRAQPNSGNASMTQIESQKEIKIGPNSTHLNDFFSPSSEHDPKIRF